MNVFQRLNYLLCVAFASLFILSCNDPSSIGSDLLDDDLLNVESTDTFTVIAQTIPGVDSILTYKAGELTNDVYIGRLEDPIFGNQTFDGFFSPGLSAVIPSFYDSDNNAFVTVDSVVMIVNVDTTLYYGDKDAIHNVDVFVLDEEPDSDDEYYSNQDLSVNMTPIGENLEFKMNFDKFTYSFDNDTTTTEPSIRLKLDNSFGEMIVMDTAAVKNDTLLRKIVPGFKIVNRPNESAVISMDLSTKSLSDVGNKLFIFYTDTISKSYNFTLGGVRHIYNEKDIAGSDLEQSFNSTETGDSVLYIQGYGGADVKLEFPTARFEALGNVLIKKAELEVTIPSEHAEDDVFSPMRIIYIDSEDSEDGERSRVIDLINAGNAQAIDRAFGGNLQEERDENEELIRRFYNFNLTAYFQNLMAENTMETGALYLEAASPELIIGRSLLNGPGHSTYPMKLKITYSIPN